jgi:hypothetical protein
MSLPNDRRRSSRVRSFLRGEILHSNGASRTECTIRDLSETGARIEAPVSVTVPEHFELSIPQRHVHHRARMVWRHGAEIGVAFLVQPVQAGPAAAPDEIGTEIRMRMLEIEAETARLRAQLAEMRAALDTVLRERKSA